MPDLRRAAFLALDRHEYFRKGLDILLRALAGLRAGGIPFRACLDTQRLLARTEGLYAGPTGVAALAAARRLLAEGALDPASTICRVITETGLKSESRVESRAGETLTYDRLVALVRERLALP